MKYHIHKMTLADGRAYRYQVSDEGDQICYIAKPTGRTLPIPTRLVEFFDPQQNPIGRLQPAETPPWYRPKYYEVFEGDSTEATSVIQEIWRLVDILLLRLPRYEIRMAGQCYSAHGGRYSGRFYEIFRPQQEGEMVKDASREINWDEVDVPEIIEAAKAEDLLSEEPTELGIEPEAKSGDGENTLDDPADNTPSQIKIGEIQRPAVGPSYVAQVQSDRLLQSPLVLISLVVLIDQESHA